MNKKILLIIFFIAFFLASLGYFVTKLQLRGINKVIHDGKDTVFIELWIDYVISDKSNLFKEGDYTNLIIRNRPHGKLKIHKVNCSDVSYSKYYLKHYGLPLDQKTGLEPSIQQCKITLLDNTAQITTNGYLSRGNKLKIGNKITIEGMYYNMRGFIVDLSRNT